VSSFGSSGRSDGRSKRTLYSLGVALLAARRGNHVAAYPSA
jgi:hypothetical protein